MADDPKISTASSVKEWVEAYYGDDAFDISKAKKIGHIYRTAQFSACCYVISKASKKAHADLFDSNYAALDTTYARIAEMCIKLLEIKFRKNRELTKDDFIDCGWENIFDKKKLDEYFEDYVGPAGILDRCQSCFPIIKDKVMGDDGEEHEVVNYKRTADGFKAVKDDFEDVRKDHTYLLTLTGAKDSGILSRENVFKLFDSTTDAASKTWKEKKSEKSTGEKALLKLNEEMFHSRYELVKSTTKNAVVAGAAVMSLGAVISGVFWPAILLIPEYSLLKKNMPDMFKSLGKYWGQIEKKFKTKRDIKRAAAAQEYIVKHAESIKRGEKKFRVPLKLRRYLRNSDITILKKQAKVVNAGLSLELSDEKKHDSELEIAKKALFNSRFYSQINDMANIVSVDAESLLDNKIKALGGKDMSFDDIKNITALYKTHEGVLPIETQTAIKNQFAQKTAEVCDTLIFDKVMDRLSYIQTDVKENLTEGSETMEILKSGRSSDVMRIKNLATLATKELSYLGEDGEDHHNMTLRQYIDRKLPERLEPDALLVNIPPAMDNDEKLKVGNVLALINNIKYTTAKGSLFTTTDENGQSYSIDKREGFGSSIVDLINEIKDENVKKECNKLLKKQMDLISKYQMRKDSQDTLKVIESDHFNGPKIKLSDMFDAIGKIGYENYLSEENTKLYTDIYKTQPSCVANYIGAKFRKQVFDKFDEYVATNALRGNIAEISKFIKRVNECQFFDDLQRVKLTDQVMPYVKDALMDICRTIPSDFNKNYDAGLFGNLKNSSLKGGGLSEILRNPQTSDMIWVKEELDTMTSLDLFKGNMQTKYSRIPNQDFKIISTIYTRDESTGLEELKPRKSSDALKVFLTETIKINGSYLNAGDYKTNLESHIKEGGKPYSQIEQALSGIVTQTTQNGEISYLRAGAFGSDIDRYAALVALKDVAIEQFRSYLYGALNQIRNNQGDSMNDWLERGAYNEYYLPILTIWNELFEKIDSATTAICSLADVRKLITERDLMTTTTASNEISLHGEPKLENVYKSFDSTNERERE